LTANGYVFFRFNEIDNLGKIWTKFFHRKTISLFFSILFYAAIIISFFIAAASLLSSGFKYETITRFAYRLTLVSEEIDVKTIASRYKNQSKNNHHLQEGRSNQENEKSEKNNKSTLDNDLSKYKKSEDKEQRYMDMGRVFMSNWWVKWISLCFLIFGLIFRALASFTTRPED